LNPGACREDSPCGWGQRRVVDITIDCQALGRGDGCRILGRSATIIFLSDQQGTASEFMLLCG
jgi:hypothetical protein